MKPTNSLASLLVEAVTRSEAILWLTTEDSTLLYASPAFCHAHDIDFENTPDKLRIVDFSPYIDAARWNSLVEHLKKEGAAKDLLLRYPLADHPEIQVVVGDIHYMQRDGEGFVWAVGRDITRLSKELKKEVPAVEQEVPEADAEAASNSPEADEKPDGKKKTTLLVAEDESYNYVLVNAILRKEYKLMHAYDGVDAVRRFIEHQPDLILMDLKMPRMGGLDAVRAIRKLSPDVPIIVYTAFVYEYDREQAFAAGCNDFLPKPFTQEQLKEMLAKWDKVLENR
jgi:CheY-like chemotaxis protein